MMPGPIRPVRTVQMIYRTAFTSQGKERSYNPQVRDTVHFSKEALEKLKTYSAPKYEEQRDPNPSRDSELQSSLDALRLDRDATIDQVKKAYYEAMKKYHPDNYTNLPPELLQVAQEKTRQIITAYTRLRDLLTTD